MSLQDGKHREYDIELITNKVEILLKPCDSMPYVRYGRLDDKL